jgi:hypothetical protein
MQNEMPGELALSKPYCHIQALPSQQVQTMLIQMLSFHFDCINHVTFMCYNLLKCPTSMM